MFAALVRPIAIAMAFLSLYWLSFSSCFLRAPMNSVSMPILIGKLQNALELEFWLHLLEPIGHIYFRRCNWYMYIYFYGLKGWGVVLVEVGRWFCWKPHFPGMRQYIYPCTCVIKANWSILLVNMLLGRLHLLLWYSKVSPCQGQLSVIISN